MVCSGLFVLGPTFGADFEPAQDGAGVSASARAWSGAMMGA